MIRMVILGICGHPLGGLAEQPAKGPAAGLTVPPMGQPMGDGWPHRIKNKTCIHTKKNIKLIMLNYAFYLYVFVTYIQFIYIYSQTSEVLGVLAALLEEQICETGQNLHGFAASRCLQLPWPPVDDGADNRYSSKVSNTTFNYDTGTKIVMSTCFEHETFFQRRTDISAQLSKSPGKVPSFAGGGLEPEKGQM